LNRSSLFVTARDLCINSPVQLPITTIHPSPRSSLKSLVNHLIRLQHLTHAAITPLETLPIVLVLPRLLHLQQLLTMILWKMAKSVILLREGSSIGVKALSARRIDALVGMALVRGAVVLQNVDGAAKTCRDLHLSQCKLYKLCRILTSLHFDFALRQGAQDPYDGASH
jgi:hypothetical protein